MRLLRILSHVSGVICKRGDPSVNDDRQIQLLVKTEIVGY